MFHPAERLYAFGLRAGAGPSKRVLMVLQAFCLKHLLFSGGARTGKAGRGPGQAGPGSRTARTATTRHKPL